MLKNKSGKIVNIHQLLIQEISSIKHVTKYIIAMSKSLAIEYAKKYIYNCVSPGFIKTNMTDKILRT